MIGTNQFGCVSVMNGKSVIGIDSLPPQAGDIAGSSVVCENQKDVKYEVPVIRFATDYEWILPSGYSLITGNNSRSISLNITDTASNGIIYVYGTNSCGSGLRSVGFPVIVNKLPQEANIIYGPTQVCQNEVVVYETDYIVNAVSYKWNLPYGTSIISGSDSRRIQVKIGLGEVGGPFLVSGYNQCGVGLPSDTLLVNAKELPQANGGQDIGICSDVYTFKASLQTSAQGQWIVLNSPGIIENANAPNSKVTNLRKGKNVFIWKVTMNGCENQDTVTITNNQLFVEAGSDQTVCGENAKFNAPILPLGTGTWSIMSGTGTNISINSPTSTVSGLGRGNNVFKWTVTYNGCQSYDSVTITNDQPSNANAGVDQIIDIPSTQLAAVLPQIGQGTWTIEKGSGIFQDPTLFSSMVYDLNFGENILVWTVVHQSCISIDKMKILNNATPFLDAGSNLNICADTTVMEALNPYPAHGVWTVIKGSAKFANNSLYNTPVTEVGKGENIFKWTITETNKYDSVVVVNNSTTPSFAGSRRELCVDSVLLHAVAPQYGKGIWAIVGGGATIVDPLNPTTVVKDLIQGKTTFKWTISLDRCVSESTVDIYNNTTSKSYAGEDQTTCEPYVYLAPTTPDYGVGAWRIISGTANIDENQKATELSVENNVLEWRITNGTCMSSDTVVITSHRPTEPNAGVDLFLCDNSTTMAANPVLIGTSKWEVLNGGAKVSNVNDPLASITSLTYGPNTFRWNMTYKECSLFDDVTINYDFVQANAGVDQQICASEITLNANSPKTGVGSWFIISGGGAAGFENQNMQNTKVSNLDKGVNKLRWTISKNVCTSSDDVEITNNLPTTPLAGPDRELCVNNAIMQGNKPVVGKGKWEVLSGSGVFVDSSSYQSLITNIGLGLNIFRWTMSNANCLLYDDVKITNNQPVNVNAGLDVVACYDTVSLYATAPTFGTGLWSVMTGSARFSDQSNYNTSIYNLAPGVNLLLWTVTSALCSVIDTVQVINGVPTDPIAGPMQDVCSASTVLAANAPTSGAGRWSIMSGTANFEDPTKNNTKVSGLNNGSNILRWTISTNYCSRFDDVEVINNLPVQAEAGLDFDVCGSTASLYGNTPLVGTGYWSVLSGNAVFSSALSGNTQVSNLGFGSNTMRWTITNKQCSSYDDITVRNNLTPWISAGVDQEVYKSTTKLIGSNTNQVAEWKTIAGNATIISPGNFETDIQNLSSGVNTFSWNITINGCTASDQVTVIYHPQPIPWFEVNTNNGCVPLTVEFTNYSIGGAPYKWDFGDNTTDNATNVVHVFPEAGEYKVVLTATSPDNVTATYDTLISVYPLPEANFYVQPTIVHLPDEQIRCYNTSTSAIKYAWDFGDSTTSFEETPFKLYKDTGTYNIQLIAISEHNCVDTAWVEDAASVRQTGSLIFPKGFTPARSGGTGGVYNPDDRTNDVFFPTGEGVDKFHMEIYNKWGILVFKTDDINIGWDGYYKSKLMDESAYVYYAKGVYNNGDEFNIIGSVVLIYAKQ